LASGSRQVDGKYRDLRATPSKTSRAPRVVHAAKLDKFLESAIKCAQFRRN